MECRTVPSKASYSQAKPTCGFRACLISNKRCTRTCATGSPVLRAAASAACATSTAISPRSAQVAWCLARPLNHYETPKSVP